jgi:hypothetical protein
MKYTLTIILLSCCILLNAQSMHYKMNGASRSEIGLQAGATFYIGEVHRTNPFKSPKLSLSLMYKYALSYRLHIRANASYIHVAGNDAESSNIDQVNRNLNFRNQIGEAALGIEINFLKYSCRDMKYPFTPYMFVQLGLSYIQPQSKNGDDWINLRELGTEGQGGDLGGKYYSPVQLVIPVGLGFKFNVAKRLAFAFEIGIRKTFTDYIDDIHGYYANNELLEAQNGSLAAYYADPSLVKYGLDGTNNGYSRGNPHTKDWYGNYMFSLVFQLSKGSSCPYR